MVVDAGESNQIRVIARNADQPNSRWYSGAGIYRPVTLWVGEDVYIPINGVKIRTLSVNPAKIEVKVKTNKKTPITAGSSIETLWRNCCDAILYACLCGQAGAGAAADALVGKINPSGKLAETWAEHYEDTPSLYHFAGKKRTVEYRESIYIGYRYYQRAKVTPAFPFGYGLSYTTFSYSDLKVSENEVSFTLTNTGNVAGAEVSQIYVSAPGVEVFCAERELKGFAKTYLEAGESKRVTVTLDDKAFRYWNVKSNQWERESGTYKISVGTSSEKMVLSAELKLAGTCAVPPYDLTKLLHYQCGKVQKVPKSEFEKLLGHPVPDGKPDISRNMTLGEMNHGRSPLGWLIWAILTGMLNKSLKKGHPDLNLLFQLNMPLRGLDVLHKESCRLTNQYDLIAIEDLDMSAIQQALRFGKSVCDNGWGMFVQMLTYKCERKGKKLVKVDRWFPSSKTCCKCGHIHKELVLTDRTYICPKCGNIMDRDKQAAKNILKEARRLIQTA